MPITPKPTTRPLVVRPGAAKTMLGNCSDAELYRKIAAGELESYLDGRRRLITVASIEADIARQVAAAADQGFQRARGADHAGLGRRRRPRKTPAAVSAEHPDI